MSNIRHWFLSQTRVVQAEAIVLSSFFLVFILGQLGRLTFLPVSPIYVHDFIIGIWLLFHFRLVIKLIAATIRWLPKHPLVLVTVVWVAAGLLWGSFQQPQLRAWLILGRVIAYILFAATISVRFDTKRVQLRGIVVLVGNLMLWLALVQYLWLPDTRFLNILGWDDHYFRLIGPLFDPNFMGMLIVLTSIFTASIHWLMPKKIQVLLQAYYAALLAVTYSRASYVTAALSTFLLICTPYPLKRWHMWQRLTMVSIAIVVFSVVLYVAPKPGGEGVKLMRTSSIIARQNTATQTFQNLSAVDVVLGKGLFTNPLDNAPSTEDPVPQHAQVPDNIFVLLLSGTGIFGTILVLSSLLYWIGRLAMKETALAIAVGVTLLHAQFNNTFFEPFIFLYLLLAVLAPIYQNQAQLTAHNHFRAKKQKKT